MSNLKLLNELTNVVDTSKKAIKRAKGKGQRQRKRKRYRRKGNVERRSVPKNVAPANLKNRPLNIMKRGRTVPYGNLKMQSLLYGTQLLDFMQANAHPFGSEGVGAVIPDCHDTVVSPTYDLRDIEIDLTSIFTYINTTLVTKFDGFIAMVVPRCMAAGFLSGVSVADASNVNYNQWNLSFSFQDANFTQLFANSTEQDDGGNVVLLDPYYLLLIPVSADGHAITMSPGNEALYGAMVVRFPKMQPILDNTSEIRIAGLGVKLNPRTPLIDTPGVAYSGMIKVNTIINLLKEDLDNAAATMPGVFTNFQNHFYADYTTEQGVNGATARYDVFQNPDQMDKQVTNLKAAIYKVTLTDTSVLNLRNRPGYKRHLFLKYGGKGLSTINNNNKNNYQDDEKFETISNCTNKFNHFSTGPTENIQAISNKYIAINSYEPEDISAATNDLIKPGAFVPCAYYQFNDSAPLLLTLRIVAHAVTEPNADFPFISETAKFDPCFNYIKNVLSDPSIFPFHTKGHSFKSALTKFNSMFGKVVRHAGRAQNMLKLLEGL
jgi:hypothetical protein